MINPISLKSSLAAIAAATLLAACGGGGSNSSSSVAENLVIQMNASNGPTLKSSLITAGAYTFSNGVPGLGTTDPTSVAITGTPANTTFSIGSAGQSATGNFSFGSCIFNVTSVSPPSGTLNDSLASKDEDGTEGLPYTITIHPCTLTINTQGSTANGGTKQVTTKLDLDATDDSAPSAPIPVTISLNGEILAGGEKIGDVSLLTGGTGSGSNN